MKLDWSHWLYTLLKTVIGGVAGAGSAWLGTLVGSQIDSNIHTLDLRQMGFVLLSSTLLNLFFFLKQSPLPEDTDKGNNGIADKLLGLLLVGLVSFGLMFGMTGCAWFHPQDIKPVAVAPGQDAALVNAERVHASALAVYREVITWETANRALLPVEVSRAVDKSRREFPKAWKEASQVLKDYRANRGDPTDVNRIAAAFAATQASLLRLKVDGATGNELLTTLNQLAESIATLKKP